MPYKTHFGAGSISWTICIKDTKLVSSDQLTIVQNLCLKQQAFKESREKKKVCIWPDITNQNNYPFQPTGTSLQNRMIHFTE